MPMYNRYIPRSDGTYQKNRVPDQTPPVPPRPRQPDPPRQQEAPPPCQEAPIAPSPVPRRPAGSVGGFLRQLIPRDFDTGDLLIVLLMLLMAGDSEEERNNSLLTLTLYLFL